jgi:Protein phosphatase 2C
VELLTIGAFARASRLSPKARSSRRSSRWKPLCPRATCSTPWKDAVRRAGPALRDLGAADPDTGTTLTAMLWSGSQLALVHVGDTRAYLLRDGELFQITHDHSVVQALLDEGKITPEEADSHPQRSLLLRAIDGHREAQPDVSPRGTGSRRHRVP